MASDKKVNQLKRRHLFVLEHMFNTIYDRVDPMYFDEYMAKMTNTSVSSKKGYGHHLMHSYVRFNDIHGIHYKIDEKEHSRPDDISRMLCGNQPFCEKSEGNDLTDNTIAKNIRKLVTEHGILVTGEVPNQKNITLYYPNESFEGLDNLVEYLLKLKFDQYSDFDNRCRNIIHSKFTKVVLNRQYIITRFREKKMSFTLRMKLPDGTKVRGEVPFLGNYRKVFDNPKPFETFIDIAARMMDGFIDKVKEEYNPNLEFEEQHIVKCSCGKNWARLQQAVEKCREALENIEKIHEALKTPNSKRYVDGDVLTYLTMDEWFELDPDAVLRREALWEDAVISESELESIISHMVIIGSPKREFSESEKSLIKERYRKECENWVVYALSMTSFSFYAMAFFRRYRDKSIAELWANRLDQVLGHEPRFTDDPYSGLENTPAYPDTTKNLAHVGEWETQLLRCVLSDYTTGLGNNSNFVPAFLGVGSIYNGDEKIPSMVSFRLDRNRVMTVDPDLATLRSF